jgi:diguanylate cyclase (GGDEF)-like protein
MRRVRRFAETWLVEENARRPITRYCVGLTGLLLFLCVWLAAVGSVAASPAPARITIEAATGNGTSSVYHLRVQASGAAVLAVLPQEVRLAELVINGKVVQEAGRDAPMGIRPFARAASAFRLAGLTPNDRVEIRMSGAGRPPVIISDFDHLAMAFDSGLWSGIGYGILLTLVLFLSVTVLAARQPTLLWYAMWIAAVMGLQVIIDGLLPLSPAGAFAALLAANTVTLLGYVGFFTTYLDLRIQTPRLFWIFAATNFAAIACPTFIGIFTHHPPSVDVVLLSNAVPMGLGITIALIRWRAGFLPASYLAFGLIGSFVFFTAKPLRDVSGLDSAFLDRWALEIFSVFDFLVFSLGIAARFRFTHREHELIKEQLRATSLAAGRDPLTGLLNRRGLYECDVSSGTVLFIDIDGFKAVNDEGGHAAGDHTLIVLAHIIRHCVRAQDAVARFGGDEFVVILADCDDAGPTQEIISRISSAVGALLPLGPASSVRIGVSIGSALIDACASFSEALEHADADAYRIKEEHHAKLREIRRLVNAPPPLPGQ